MRFSCCHVPKATEGDVPLSHSTVEGLTNKLTPFGCLVQGSVGPKKNLIAYEWGQ